MADLREVASRLRLSGDNPFRARAYETGADALEAMSDSELGRRLDTQRLTEVPGIGPALAGIIAEIASTGGAELLARLRADTPSAVLELTQIRGITVQRARHLHAALGVSGVDELASAARAGQVRAVKGFGPKSEAALLAAIESYRAREQVIRLVDARDAAAALARFVASRRDVIAADVAGPVRRWQEVIDELSVVTVVTNIGGAETVLDDIAQYPPLARVEDRQADALAGRLADGVRVRVRITTPERRGVALVEETGPLAHVQALRERAAQRGLAWAALVAPDEAALYGQLGLGVIPPEARAWAPRPGASGNDPELDGLVSLGDIRGAVHCHTTESDGRHTLAEMARAADERGLRYLTVTDHSPTASYAGGLTVDRLRRQWDDIARVQEDVKVRLLRGTESDILADGALDYPDAVLEQLDVIIASIHGRYRMDAAAMTARLLRALRLPVFKIWGHPLGQLVLRRPPIGCDVEAVLDAVASSRAAIEISGDPYRLDLPPAWIPPARRRGIRFVISTDAHATGDLDNLIYGVAMARRGGVQRGEVLNTLPERAFRDAVHP